MKLKLTISDQVPGFEGSYDLDLNDLVMDDYHLIKEMSGVRAAELFPALSAVDTDVLCALSVIAVGRAGKYLNPELLKKTTFGSVMAEPVSESGDVEIPPAQKEKKSDSS